MNSKEDFQSGFAFALQVCEAAGSLVDIRKVEEVLKQVTTGETSVIPSPADLIAEHEKQIGSELPIDLKRRVQTLMSGEIRSSQQQLHIEQAKAVLEVLTG